MRKITQQEFDNFPVVDGIKQCPTGDYSAFDVFRERCSFGDYCSFGRVCSFGDYCSFGRGCSFGDYCSFGRGCSFGMACSFSNRCSFGDYCSFGRGCSFGDYCSFGRGCSFGMACSFSNRCSFGACCGFSDGCTIDSKRIKHNHVINLSGVGKYKRTLYIWITASGVYCQAGCFFGSESDFLKAVRKKYGDNSDYERAVEFLKSINEEYL